MRDQATPAEAARPQVRPGERGTVAASPSSSRMLTSYLSDTEQLLDEQRWDAALREACDLPRIAVALADPRLRSSGEHVQRWCTEWIRPPGAERDAHGLDCERLGRGLAERIAALTPPNSVPTHALRRLQLRRHVRILPRGFSAARAGDLPPRETEVMKMVTALLDATRRWYARSGCHDLTVQANLARLAVLR